jgi:hypothetical protein
MPLLPENSVQPANPPTEPGKGPEAETPKKAVGTGSNAKQLALNFGVGIASSLFAASIFEDITSGFKGRLLPVRLVRALRTLSTIPVRLQLRVTRLSMGTDINNAL